MGLVTLDTVRKINTVTNALNLIDTDQYWTSGTKLVHISIILGSLFFKYIFTGTYDTIFNQYTWTNGGTTVDTTQFCGPDLLTVPRALYVGITGFLLPNNCLKTGAVTDLRYFICYSN